MQVRKKMEPVWLPCRTRKKRKALSAETGLF
nr:MAG TPA: hypothetical protein [Caudoviricetes sp.]